MSELPSIIAHGMYEITYTTTGSTTRHSVAHTIGSPSSQPGRSQPVGAGSAGGRIDAGSSGEGVGANGPNPARPATAKTPHTATPTRTSPNARPATGIEWPDSATEDWGPFNAARARNTSPPATIGPPIAIRISSMDQAIGWRTAATAAT